MKLLLSFLFATVSFAASAQHLGPDVDKQIEESIRERVAKGSPNKVVPSLPQFNTGLPQRPGAKDQRVPPRVHALPQDAMPCVVPDTKDIAAIPNAAPKVYPYRKDMPTAPLKKDVSR